MLQLCSPDAECYQRFSLTTPESREKSGRMDTQRSANSYQTVESMLHRRIITNYF